MPSTALQFTEASDRFKKGYNLFWMDNGGFIYTWPTY